MHCSQRTAQQRTDNSKYDERRSRLNVAEFGKKGMAHEFDGKKYERASSHQKEWGTKLIAELSLIGSEHVLDLGCGDGVLTSQIAELVPDGDVLAVVMPFQGMNGKKGRRKIVQRRQGSFKIPHSAVRWIFVSQISKREPQNVE